VRPGAQAALLRRTVQVHDRVDAFQHLQRGRWGILVDFINYILHNGQVGDIIN
jgi:hypothetical protein